MNIVQLLTLLLPSYRPQEPGETPKEVWRDYPGCGQLGDPNKKECFWDYDWGPSPLEGVKGDPQKQLDLLVAKLQLLGMCQDLCEVIAKRHLFLYRVSNSNTWFS